MSLAVDVVSFRCPVLIWIWERALWIRCKFGDSDIKVFCLFVLFLSLRDDIVQWMSWESGKQVIGEC